MVTPDLFSQALLSASAGCEAVDRIMGGELAAAFCAVRPPGHHANRFRALGFCVFNNVAVAAEYAREHYGVKSVLIVDWDAHPGNGTQEIFFEDPAVFTLSIHQADLFEEAGGRELVGRGPGEGFNRNEPVRAGIPADEYMDIFAGAVREVAAAFRPELLLISAGFDAHQSDPSSSLPLDHNHFAAMTDILLRAAGPFTGGRVLSILEGGYNLHALRLCAAAHLKAMAEHQADG
jgi:acetoin utilization deacetylase AcuC-like enzyme